MKNIILVSLVLLLSGFTPNDSVQPTSPLNDEIKSDMGIELTDRFWAQKYEYEGYTYIKLYRFDDKGFEEKSTFYRTWRVRLNPDGSESPRKGGMWGIGSWELNGPSLTVIPYNDFAKTDLDPIAYKIFSNSFKPTNPQGVTKDVPQSFKMFTLLSPPSYVPSDVIERMKNRFR